MAESLTVQIKALLDDYSEEVAEATEKAIESVSRQAVQRLKNDSPRRTGEYASGWKRKKDGKRTVTIYNAKAPGLTHLLENGHVIRNKKGTYGRTRPIKHIQPVEQWANDELVREIERRLL